MTFATERPVKAVRKARRCCACDHMIEVGSPATEWAGMSEGEFVAVTYHTECRAAEVALNDMHKTWHADDWQGLDQAEPEDWIALAVDHPVVAARFGFPTNTGVKLEGE